MNMKNGAEKAKKASLERATVRCLSVVCLFLVAMLGSMPVQAVPSPCDASGKLAEVVSLSDGSCSAIIQVPCEEECLGPIAPCEQECVPIDPPCEEDCGDPCTTLQELVTNNDPLVDSVVAMLCCDEACDDPSPCGEDPCGLPDPCDLNLCNPDPDPMPCTADDPNAYICQSLRCGLGDSSPMYTEEECGPLDPPTASATATIGSTHDQQNTCTGTKRPIATGSVSATVGGGAVIPASVTAGIEYEVLMAWDFACSYSMFAQAWGSDGTLRQVHVQAWQSGVYRDAGAPCNYDGLLVMQCSTERFAVLSDAYSGSGIAGPGGSGVDPVKMPTQVEICPAPGFSTVKALNRGSVVTTESAQAFDNWVCKDFAIHYNT